MLINFKYAEESLQHAAASVVQAIAQKSPDVFSRHLSLVLPLAFFGMHEQSDNPRNQSTVKDDKQVDQLYFCEIWTSFWNRREISTDKRFDN